MITLDLAVHRQRHAICDPAECQTRAFCDEIERLQTERDSWRTRYEDMQREAQKLGEVIERHNADIRFLRARAAAAEATVARVEALIRHLPDEVRDDDYEEDVAAVLIRVSSVRSALRGEE